MHYITGVCPHAQRGHQRHDGGQQGTYNSKPQPKHRQHTSTNANTNTKTQPKTTITNTITIIITIKNTIPKPLSRTPTTSAAVIKTAIAQRGGLCTYVDQA